VLPEETLVPSATGQVVFKLVDGKAVRSPVTVGLRREGQVEILSGVSAGDTIVSAGQIRLQRDGLPVRVVDAGAKPAEPAAAAKAAPPAAAPAAPSAGGPSASPAAAPAPAPEKKPGA
jgi:membrane fusion protein (multidrug efflux system)